MRALTKAIVFAGLMLLISCGGGKVPTHPQPPPPPAQDLSGRITDSYGEPLAGASILINGEEIGITTDDNGEFLIPGQFVRSKNRIRIGVKHRNMFLGEEEVPVAGGKLNLRFGDPDAQGGKLNGLVYDKDTEEPVPNVLLTLFTPQGKPWTAFEESTAEGTFEFTDVPEGDYQLLVYHSDFKMKILQVTIEAGKTTQLLISLEMREGVVQPADEYFVSGVVLDKDTKEPVSGAFIQAHSDSGWFYVLETTKEEFEMGMLPLESRHMGEPGMPSSLVAPPPGEFEPPVYQDTITDEDGQFAFPDPFNGKGVYISINADGYMPFSNFYLWEEDKELQLTIELTPVNPVHVSGRVVDTSSQPIEGALVEFVYLDPNFRDGPYMMPAGAELRDAEPEDVMESMGGEGPALMGIPLPSSPESANESYDNYAMQKFLFEQRESRNASQEMPEFMPFGYYSAVTDENGNFDLGEIPAGYYTVFVTAYGYLGYGDEVEITADTTDFEVVLEPVPVGEIVGVVVDEEGNPIPDALINATQPNVDPFTFSDENGRYHLTNVPVGAWRVGAYKQGYRADTREDVEVLENEQTTVNLVLVKLEEQEPRETITFRGRIVDAVTGEPVEGAEMAAIEAEDNYFYYTVSSTDGYFEMKLIAGEYTLNVVKEGYIDLFTWFWVDEQFHEMDFYLWPIGSGWLGGGGPMPMNGWIEDGEMPPPSAPPSMPEHPDGH